MREHIARVLLLSAVLVGLTPPSASASSDRLGPPFLASEAPGDLGAEMAIVRAAYDLLRVRYVQPVPAEALIGAMFLDNTGPDHRDRHTGPASDDPDQVWQAFATTFPAVVRTVPDGAPIAHTLIRRMAASLNDCHTSFTPDYARDSTALARAEPYGGIGAVITEARRFDPLPPGPVVTQVFEDSPAMRSGLRPGDAVVAVDGVVAETAVSSLTERVRGVPGTHVVLTVDRLGVSGQVDIRIDRANVRVPLVTSSVVTVAGVGRVGVVRLRTFAQPAVEPFVEAVARLRQEGVRAWVVDVRSNGGGDLGVYVQLTSLFVHGALARTIDRSGATRDLGSVPAAGPDGSGPVDRRLLAVLVNSDTASAAELLAGTIEDYGTGRVFGERSAGCFGTSQIFRLPDGSGLWITVSALQTGLANRDVHRTGIAPSVIATQTRADFATGADTVLATALAWIRGRGGSADATARWNLVR